VTEQWCIEIEFAKPFDVLDGAGMQIRLGKGNKIVLPFDTRESAEMALTQMRSGVYRRAASGIDGKYPPLIDGEVVGNSAFVAGIIEQQ
jgi:hypothetical protein